MSRKLIVLIVVVVVMVLAGLPAITAALVHLGVVGLAAKVRAEYFTGTAVAVIAALLILLPRQVVVGIRFFTAARTCRVCGTRIERVARYCPQCGSRV
jgi:hypothetical protein